jgi:hypothetical protein
VLNLKLGLWLFSGVWLLLIVALVTPKPIAYNTVEITWITQPETTYVNIWNTTSNYMQYATIVSSGVTNTLTLEASEGVVFQIQEYKLVNGRLELITFFNLDAVPHSEFPTPTNTPVPSETPQPSVTPNPTATATPVQTKHRFYNGIVMR